MKEERRLQDYKDLQDEYEGRENGRAKRFLSDEFHVSGNSKQAKEKKIAEYYSRLQQLLMNDTAYAALYEKTMDKLLNAEEIADRELQKAKTAMETANEEYQLLLSQAAMLPNKTRVFKDNEGRIWSEHGEEVTGDARDEIVWKGNEPSYEEFLSKRQLASDTKNNYDAWHSYRFDTLGDIRNRLMDEQNP